MRPKSCVRPRTRTRVVRGESPESATERTDTRPILDGRLSSGRISPTLAPSLTRECLAYPSGFRDTVPPA